MPANPANTLQTTIFHIILDNFKSAIEDQVWVLDTHDKDVQPLMQLKHMGKDWWANQEIQPWTHYIGGGKMR